MPGLSRVLEQPESNGRVTTVIDRSIDASRFSQAGTGLDVARGRLQEPLLPARKGRVPVDSGAARLVNLFRRPTESAFQ